MIRIKIYDKGRDETGVYIKIKCPANLMSAQLGALLITTCKMVRDAMTEPDKDAFLQMMGRAWDAQEERNNKNE